MKNLTVQAEIVSKRFKEHFDITIKNGKGMKFHTTIPTNNNHPVLFSEGEPVNILYYFGDLLYIVDAFYHSKNNEEYLFTIKDINIDQNIRGERRENINMEAKIGHYNRLIPITLVDISEKGAKIKTKNKLKMKNITLYYEKGNESLTQKTTIKWEEFEDNMYFYGLEFEK